MKDAFTMMMVLLLSLVGCGSDDSAAADEMSLGDFVGTCRQATQQLPIQPQDGLPYASACNPEGACQGPLYWYLHRGEVTVTCPQADWDVYVTWL